jgi:hypothetical protein
MIKDFETISLANPSTDSRPAPRRRSNPFGRFRLRRTAQADTYTPMALIARPQTVLPWNPGLLDLLKEPLTRFHE